MTTNEKLIELNKVFTPSAPIKEDGFFAGRYGQLKKIVDAINQDGQHGILYGERGVGKTSLANIMPKSFTNIFSVRVTCNRKDTFASLWSKALKKVPLTTTISGVGFKPMEKHKSMYFEITGDHGNSTLLSSEIEGLLADYPSSRFLFVFDEFDNILDNDTRESFADLIKSFSDNLTNTTIVLIGIADTIDTLIGSHRSLERCLKQVKMPRMSDDESEEIIVTGMKSLDIRTSETVKKQIIEFSSGFPHYVHLLCKYGSQKVIEEETQEFTEAHLIVAIERGIENTNEQLRSSYRKAVLGSVESHKWRNVLFACAQSISDDYNCFTLPEITEQYNKIAGTKVKSNSIAYNLKQLCQEDRGNILEKLDKGVNARYRFANPMMRAFIKLKISHDLRRPD